MEINLVNIAIAAGISVLSSIAGEFINWYLIYRHEEYKKLLKDISETQLKFDLMKEKQLLASGPVKERKLKNFEEGLKNL